MFQKIKLEEGYWGVFLVSSEYPKGSRYLLTGLLDRESDADMFIREFHMIAESWV